MAPLGPQGRRPLQPGGKLWRLLSAEQSWESPHPSRRWHDDQVRLGLQKAAYVSSAGLYLTAGEYCMPNPAARAKHTGQKTRIKF